MVAGDPVLARLRGHGKETDTAAAPVVTFDLFSALIDSRTGGARTLQEIAETRGWSVSGASLYDRWDAHNKEAQRRCRDWVPYAVLARDALAGAYRDLDLDGDVDADLGALFEALPDWPLWPDVADGLPALATDHPVGLLSNVDDVLLARTRASGLVDASLSMTSERLRAYKPDSRIYHRARAELGPMVHVASSARDVRGSLEAGLPVVRLRRRGHGLDPDGPLPDTEVGTVYELPAALGALRGVS